VIENLARSQSPGCSTPRAGLEIDFLVNVLLASPLETVLVDRIAAVDPRLRISYRPDLLGQPRYPGDHFPPIQRTRTQADEWARLLGEAEVLLDVDQLSTSDFLRRAPRVRWIQSSSSGVGEWVRRLGLVDAPVVVTNAAGIHATPLAEFALFAMLYFARRWPRMAAEQRAHHWERCAIDTLENKTLGIIGLGQVGRTVARLARQFGMRVVGTRRSGAESGVDHVYSADEVRVVLGQSDYVVLCVPHTAETAGLIGAGELARMKPGAVLINIARGTIVDEAALIEDLRSGRLAGAALDVFSREPLPADSPLWDMPTVLVTPHSMSTACNENERLTDLFCDNLRRYLTSAPLRNQVDKVRGY
jgi:phosphoglycerate dehydrogenase-like enzyme